MPAVGAGAGAARLAGGSLASRRAGPAKRVFPKLCLTITQIRTDIPRSARAAMRDDSRSSRNVARVAMDAAASGGFAAGRNARSVRRSRVVLAPRPWRQAGGKAHSGDGGKKGRSPGRARISRKAIARGKPGCLGCTCQIRVRFFLPIAHGDCGRSRRPAFPAPSVRRGSNELAKLRRNRCRENRGCSRHVRAAPLSLR